MPKLRLINPAPAGNRARNGNADIFTIVPLQLLTVGSIAAAAGWEVSIQDEIVEDLRLDDSPDLVGISIKACTSQRGYQIAQQYRSRGVPVVFGGSHASLAPHLVAPHADAVVQGGVEETLPGLLRDALERRLAPVYKESANGPLPSYQIRWDLLRHKAYRVASIVATRGCPLRCSFCSIPGSYGFKVRARPVEDVVEDLARSPTPYFLLWDENPTADPQYAEVLFLAISSLRKTWFGEATSMVARDARLLRVIAKSGCCALYVGVESFNQAGLNKVKKGFNRVAQYRDTVMRLNDHGIAAHAGVVLGFDGDGESIFDETYEGLRACGFNSASFKILTPYPGTSLWSTMSAAGRIFDHDLDHYDENHVVFQPSHLSPEALYEGYLRVTREFYSYPNIARRIARAAVRSGPGNVIPMVANFGWRKAYFHDLQL